MELLSRQQREGQPVACAYGCQIASDGSLRAGLLFVRAGLPDEPLTLTDPESKTAFRVRLPEDFINADEDVYGIDADLKGAP